MNKRQSNHGIPRGVETKVTEMIPDNLLPKEPVVTEEVDQSKFLTMLSQAIEYLPKGDQNILKEHMFEYSGNQYPRSLKHLISNLTTIREKSFKRASALDNNQKGDNKKELLELFGLFLTYYKHHISKK